MNIKSLNVYHFGMVEIQDSKVWHQGHLKWHDLPTEFHTNLPIGSKVIRGDTHTHRQNNNFLSLTFLFKENRLKMPGSKKQGNWSYSDFN
jgi:hypothetical protein